MRIDSVTATAFGPFRGTTLEFAPQLTVIYGPNEAGKSSWHAAIYAALCGMRRAKGPPRSEDRDFTDRCRPWVGGAWEVRCLVRLDDGRRVELRQNLSDLAHCSAIDADLGRDVLDEILNEGTPDAARWLGLDRQSFLSVACVRQGEVGAIADQATSLQDELQKAAASVARDATAGEAIARMENFESEHVGQDRANSTKPLHRSKMRLAAAEAALADARDKHANWLRLEAQALTLRKRADEAERRLRMAHALLARNDALTWLAKAARARDLSARHPGGPPAPLPEDERLAGDVAAALSEWENRPDVPVLSGESAAAIRAEMDALPLMPVGDQAVPVEITNAFRAFERSVHALEIHGGNRPAEIQTSDAKGLTPDRLRDLARDLDTPIPSLDSGREAAYSDAQRRLEAATHPSRSRPLVAALAVAALVGGAALWVFGSPLIGSAFAISGVSGLLWIAFRPGDAARERVLGEFRTIEAQILSQRQAVESAGAKVSAARRQVEDLALPADGKGLREAADDLVLAEKYRQDLAEWSRIHEALRAEAASRTQTLRESLRQVGITQIDDARAGYNEYERVCQSRAEQAGQAAKREPLARQLAAQGVAENAVLAAEARRSGAREAVLDVTTRCGRRTEDVEMAIIELRRWQATRQLTLSTFDVASREYAELKALLSDGTLENLETQTADRQRHSATLSAEFDALPELSDGVSVDEEVTRCEAAAHDASHAATAAEAQALERARDVPSVAETEEALASAQEESERVTRLERTLTLALGFLRAAEEGAHRDIAPILAAGLRQWLPNVTRGRYADARVDPSDLTVQVLGPDQEWRNAELLSHGTAEQIYLLLRVVLAQRLATTGETCPLILDDVFVHCDRVRKTALLGVISAVSRTRQVILFTQEDEVRQWAQENLVLPDRLVVLPGPLEGPEQMTERTRL